ncbi:RNA-binding protein 48 [Solea senegalensis]|uniref:RNA-binding protein 48 n=1 Tax=Solea senegalensis TaxID=28829 RepID=A0AAV6R7T2_SOLSE|nr:RNA-binding protein 48 [Solea senegalensis]KAG7501383.1 RNA-binding protein 48 [Solea senegalensis]
MAACGGNSSGCWVSPEVYKHHEQRKVCISRPKYREGRAAKAVKVYTINLESHYLMVQGVPAIGVMTELIQLCALYGAVEEYRPLDEYPAEEFTEVYLVKFQKLTSARAAKRHMDEKSFYGGVLHVCYVPEYESVEDTRLKLLDRRRYIMRTARNKARQREDKDGGTEEPLTSNTATTSEKIISQQDQRLHNYNIEDSSNSNHYSDFPLLPLPPYEHHYLVHKNQHGTMHTEDKMGTLYNAIIDTKQRPAQKSSSDREKSREHRPTPNQASAVRFIPRNTHLENRKRKMEDTVDHTCTELSGKNDHLIGPKLPEPPKLDMEDDSLNTTAMLIRNTMKQVGSVPDVKPVEKKMKPRRRI